MTNLGLVHTAILSLLVVGCGSGTMRSLQAISLDPAVADGQDFSNGQVPFVATGHFNRPPLTETPLQVGWSVSDTNIATIGSDGVAQCVAGSIGTVTVTGGIREVGINGRPGGGLDGTARLTCP